MELAIILTMLLIVVTMGAIKLTDQGLSFPFKRKANLFTPVERSFYDLIDEAAGAHYRVISRVRLSDIVSVKSSADRKTAHTAAARASGKYLDFVLCSKDDMTPIMAIDLVHQNGKEGYKNQRDWFTSGALDAARIPHARIKVKSGYTVKDIRECIDGKLAPIKAKQARQTPKPLIEGTLNNPAAKELRPTRPIRSNKPVAA